MAASIPHGWKSTLLSSQLTPWLPYLALAALVTYPILCRSLRYRYLRRLHKKYPFGPEGTPGKKPWSAMTDHEAYEILRGITAWEFPSVREMGLEYALIRTYAIPSISKLLLRTQQLSAAHNVAKRYADTGVIEAEITGNPPDSERCREAFARLNYLHGVYIKAGKISNDDMLYVLSLFMAHPLEYINRLDWRPVSELERCAYGTFHKSMGEAMEIDLSPLPSASKGWKDGLHFFDELDGWAKAYEEREMVPHQDNYATAVHSLNLFVDTMPGLVRPFVGPMAVSGMDERFREAVMFDKPSPIHYAVFDGIFAVKRFVCRWLLLPRITPYSIYAREVAEGDLNPDGSRNLVTWSVLPIYVRPTSWNRWGPGAWVNWLMGQPAPGDKGMYPKGYVLKDVGPQSFVGKGRKEAEATTEKLRVTRRGGCPFA